MSPPDERTGRPPHERPATITDEHMVADPPDEFRQHTSGLGEPVDSSLDAADGQYLDDWDQHRAGDEQDPAAARAGGADVAEPDSWKPIDLGPYLRGQVERTKPTLGLARNDGLRLLYPGKEHAVIGEMESGKGWLAVACAAAELHANAHVVYVHFEEADPSDTIERLRALGVPVGTIEKLFHFVAPGRKVSSDVLLRLLDPVPTLVVLDGVNEAMALHDWKIREEDGAALFRRHLVKPCTRAGSAVLSADHVVKDRENRGRYALGSIHKGNALTGALFVLENADPFGRRRRGRSHVYVTKDRPGYLRHQGRSTKTPGKTLMGELVVDDQQVYTPDLELNFYATTDDTAPAPPSNVSSPDQTRAQADDDQVLATIERLDARGSEVNLRAVRANAGISKDRTENALERLKYARKITEAKGARKARVFGVAGSVAGAPLSIDREGGAHSQTDSATVAATVSHGRPQSAKPQVNDHIYDQPQSATVGPSSTVDDQPQSATVSHTPTGEGATP